MEKRNPLLIAWSQILPTNPGLTCSLPALSLSG